jgi:hypothetical protein
MRVFPRNNAATAWAARTGRQECIGKTQPLARQFIDVGCFNYIIPVTTEIVPTDIIGNDENKVGVLRISEPTKEHTCN